MLLVDTRVGIESIGPGERHEFHKIVVSLFVLGEYHKVAAGVFLVDMLGHRTKRHIHLAAENGDEKLLFSLLDFGRDGGAALGRCLLVVEFFFEALYQAVDIAVFLLDIVEKLFDTKHVAMIGNRYASHSVGNRLIYKRGNRSLTIENGIL